MATGNRLVPFVEFSPRGRRDREVALSAGFRFLSWDYFEVNSEFLKLQEIEARHPSCLHPWMKKKTVVYISHRWLRSSHPDPEGTLFCDLRREAARLRIESDGFFLDYSCLFLNPRTAMQTEIFQRQMACMNSFIFSCHLYVACPIDDEFGYLRRGWLLFEFLSAINNKRLVINNQVASFFQRHPNFIETMSLTVVRVMIEDAAFTQALDREIVERLLTDQWTYVAEETNLYVLLPVRELYDKARWEDMNAVAVGEIDPERVLMISHRWRTEDHPDPDYDDMHLVQEYLATRRGCYDFVFFDWRCLDQDEFEASSMLKVDELYAKSPCLCLCHGDYFQRTWCLFEVMVNNFNRGEPKMIGDVDPSTRKWMKHARLVQEFGFINTLDESFIVGGTHTRLPRDRLDFKGILRHLVVESSLTNNGDRRVILNLLDYVL